MPCQVRQGKRQRPGLAFVKNDYPRQGRRGFSFGKDIMETNTFEYIWSLLNPQGDFVQLPRGFTVLSSMAHRTFYVYYVRIGFGQRLSEPPYIDHVWAIPLRFCPTSPRFYRTLIDGKPYFLRPFRPNRIRTTAL